MSFWDRLKYKLLDEKVLNGDSVKGIPVPIDLHKIDEFTISPVANPSIVKDIKLCISNAGLDKSNLNQLPKPSVKALKKAIKKVERLDESNDKSLNSFENYKESKILLQDYLSQVITDASGNTVPYGVVYSSRNTAPYGLVVDPSENTVVYHINGSNDFSHKKIVQQCQCYKRDTNIKLNRKPG